MYCIAACGFRLTPWHAFLCSPIDQDVVTGDFYGSLQFYENSGDAANPVFGAPTASSLDGIANTNAYASPTLVDLNGDGLLDLVVGATGTLDFFRNIGKLPGCPVLKLIQRKHPSAAMLALRLRLCRSQEMPRILSSATAAPVWTGSTLLCVTEELTRRCFTSLCLWT